MSEPPVQLDELLPTDTIDEDESDEFALVAVYPDNPPKSGTWVDIDDVLANPTDDELEAGRRMGEEIDPDDDDSTGL